MLTSCGHIKLYVLGPYNSEPIIPLFVPDKNTKVPRIFYVNTA